VKISPVVLVENILIEIASRVHIVVWRISSMMDLYHIFQFVKERCHGNQIIFP